MNRKIKRKKISLWLLFLAMALVMVPMASATNLDNHIAGIGTMAHPTSNAGIAGCSGCHGNLGSSTTTGFCTGCHAFPVFTLAVAANPPTITAGSSTTVTFTVNKTNNVNVTNITAASGATVALSGASVSTSGTTDSAGILAKLVNPTSAGAITATATLTGFNSVTATVDVRTPTPAPVLTTIIVTPATKSLAVGGNQTFAAAGFDQNGSFISISPATVWNSSNTTVGTIDSAGVFTALAAGMTTITATNGTDGTVSGTATVTVVVPVLTTITVSPPTKSLAVNGTQTFTATALDQLGNIISAIFTWASSNPAVGTIDAAGKFTALSAGTTTITAANGTVNVTALV